MRQWAADKLSVAGDFRLRQTRDEKSVGQSGPQYYHSSSHQTADTYMFYIYLQILRAWVVFYFGIQHFFCWAADKCRAY